MQLYESPNIALRYDPATAILSVEWPTLREPSLQETRRGLQVLVNYARNYHIENLLLGESETVFSTGPGGRKAMVAQFVRALHATRVQRVARVRAAGEKAAKGAMKTLAPGLTLRSFGSRAEAISWLAG